MMSRCRGVNLIIIGGRREEARPPSHLDCETLALPSGEIYVTFSIVP